jgi:hypothetical protein
MGRVAEITRHGGVASSYDCCMCACPGQYQYTTVAPATSCPIGVGSTDQDTAEAAFIPPCGGSQYLYNITTSTAWSSTNTGVFTLNNVSPKGLMTGVGAGLANANSQGPTECYAWYMMGTVCQCSNSAPAYGTTSCSVQFPYSAGVVRNVAQGTANCGSGASGWSRTVYLQLYDLVGQPIKFPLISMSDYIQIGSPNDLGATNTSTGTHVTDNWGQWPDTYFVCSTGCPGSGETDALQYWTANLIPLGHVNLIIYKCSSITIDGK